ncbi:MAG: hypothetical protein RLZ97_1748 [Verrucomicrobiota bacterium]
MTSIIKITALVGLLLTTAGPVLTYLSVIDIEKNKLIMLIGMIIWFIGATPWLGSDRKSA